MYLSRRPTWRRKRSLAVGNVGVGILVAKRRTALDPSGLMGAATGGALPWMAQPLHGFPALVVAVQRTGGYRRARFGCGICRSVDGQHPGGGERAAVKVLPYVRREIHRY